MDKLDVMKLLLRVAETGSFSKAARQMRMAQSTASKQIALLEKRLGAQLVRRTSRGLALTDAGQHYYDEAPRLIGEFEALDDAVRERERSPAGLVRVTSPPGFAAAYLLPELGSFFARYPGLFHLGMVAIAVDRLPQTFGLTHIASKAVRAVRSASERSDDGKAAREGRDRHGRK